MSEIKYCCPFCTDSRFRCYWNPEKNVYYCHNCGARGHGHPFKDSKDFFLKNQEEFLVPKIKTDLEKISIFPLKTAPKYLQDYALKRHLTLEDINTFNIGWTSQFEYKNRLIFPLYNEENELIFFQARGIFDNQIPKYKTWKGCKKSNFLYDARKIKTTENIIIVEGILNAISIGGIAVLGKDPSNFQIENLCALGNSFIVYLDFDALNYSFFLAEELLIRGKKIKIAVSVKDANANIQEAKKAINTAKEISFTTFYKTYMHFLNISKNPFIRKNK